MLLSLESQLAPLPDGLWYLLMGTTLLVAMGGGSSCGLGLTEQIEVIDTEALQACHNSMLTFLCYRLYGQHT